MFLAFWVMKNEIKMIGNDDKRLRGDDKSDETNLGRPMY